MTTIPRFAVLVAVSFPGHARGAEPKLARSIRGAGHEPLVSGTILVAGGGPLAAGVLRP